jgi:protein-tyrosine phosphatase
MAAVVLGEEIQAAGLAHRVRVVSSGTGTWHVGEPMDRRAAATLLRHGHDPSQHRAALFEAPWFAEHDLILAMDEDNLRDIQALAREPEERTRIRMFRDFDPQASDDRAVPDPFYGGPKGFEAVYAIVARTSEELVRRLGSLLDPV